MLGENPAHSEADRNRALKLLGGLEFLVVQDLFFTATAELADVVLPAAAGWCESEGTVTNSERRVQRVRRAVPAAGRSSRRHRDHLRSGAPDGPRLGRAECGTIWDEVRALSPMHAGMSYRRLEEPAASNGPATTSPIRARCSCTAGSGRRR